MDPTADGTLVARETLDSSTVDDAAVFRRRRGKPWKKGDPDPDWVKRDPSGDDSGQFIETPDVFLPEEESRAKIEAAARAKLNKDIQEMKAKPEHETPVAYEGWERCVNGQVIMPWDEVMRWMNGPEHEGKHSLLEHIEDSWDVNGNPVKVLSKSRELVHRELVRKCLEGVPKRKKGRAWMLGGGPGSGKSTVAQALGRFPMTRKLADYGKKPPGQAALIAADDFKMALPEWDWWLPRKAGPYAHNESLLIAQAAKEAAIKGKLDMVVDGTGDGGTEIVQAKLQKLKDAGYYTEGVYVTVPTAEASIRAIVRGLETGRTLSMLHLGETHRGVSRDVPSLMPTPDRSGLTFDLFSLFETDVPEGEDPIPIVLDGVVIHPDLWARFLGKAGETTPEQAQAALTRAMGRTFPALPAQGLTSAQVKAITIQHLQDELRQAEAIFGLKG